MRRLRSPRIVTSVLLFFCCFLITLSALLRIGLRLGIDSHLLRLPADEQFSASTAVRHPDRPWFFRGGMVKPRPPRIGEPAPSLWPHESGGDRIVNQLMYLPPGYPEYRNATPKLKRILLRFGRRGWSDLPMGRDVFIRDRCPVDTCEITVDKRGGADLVLFKDRFAPPSQRKRPYEQIWMLFLLECPYHTQSFTSAAGVFNWTASYRLDSDLVAPYEKWVPFPDVPDLPPRGVAARKKGGRVAWFVSNCAARNKRLQFARELSKHIGVDIFGKCGSGPKKCPRSSSDFCFRMLDHGEYKFYLAFENSNCRDYVTEKFFVNGLGHDVIPIVMGARPEDYKKVAPPHSYIHIEDFRDPAHLAEFLHSLASNDSAFNAYFRWKGRGEFVNTRFWCRLCAMLHAPVVPKVYTDIETWWAGKGTCTTDDWRMRTTPTTIKTTDGG